jgi:hypothetical protein
MTQKNILQIGDLVWYNVGGRGYETVGLVVETADLWDSTCTWQPKPQKYLNCIRIQWMRKGKLMPCSLNFPLFRTYWARQDRAFSDGSFNPADTFPARHLDKNIIAGGDLWFEGRFFKAVGSAGTRRKQ